MKWSMIVWNWCHDLPKKIGWSWNARIVLTTSIKTYCVITFSKYPTILLSLILTFDFSPEEEDSPTTILILCSKGWSSTGAPNCLEALILSCKTDVLFPSKPTPSSFISWWSISMASSISDPWFVRWEAEEKSVALNFAILEFDEKLLEWSRCIPGYKLFELFPLL